MPTIAGLAATDIRFPTSKHLDGSDAMNPDPDYSAAYLILETSDVSLSGHASVFTIGRGNDIQVAAVAALAQKLVGRDLDEVLADIGSVYRELCYDSQFRWLGPEKGVIHMAIGAVVNALWDLKAKRAGLPLWKLLSALSPEQVVSQIDFRYLNDELTESEALEILRSAEPGKVDRIAQLERDGYPAYTTSPGWLGYSDEKLSRLCREAMAAGFRQIKLKVGADLKDDIRRMRIAREVCGANFPIAIDANQRWGVNEAIEWVGALAEFNPAWVEEPTSPDDVLGHATIARAIAPIPVATGEHMANRVIAKQLLQLRGCEVLQVDAARVAGVNENLAILLLAAKYGVRVCPHAGGVGLCEAVQHLAMFDFTSVSCSLEDHYLEYVDHLHEHYLDPVLIENGSYRAPSRPGNSQEMHTASRARYQFPDGEYWQSEQ
ncbi:MAG: hypothetical protein RL198_918 [Actinomycetota bacterium]